MLPLGTKHRDELSAKLFSSAPAIYNFNVPRCFTMLLRAREFAGDAGNTLLWCLASDVPLLPEDRELPIAESDQKRNKWLHRHDQGTQHITSMMPLVNEMPISLTEAIGRPRRLYRGRRGFVYGWALHDDWRPVDIDGEVL